MKPYDVPKWRSWWPVNISVVLRITINVGAEFNANWATNPPSITWFCCKCRKCRRRVTSHQWCVRSLAATLVLSVLVLTLVATKFGLNRGKTVAAINGLIFTQEKSTKSSWHPCKLTSQKTKCPIVTWNLISYNTYIDNRWHRFKQGHTSVVIISTEAINRLERFRKNNMILFKYTQ